MHHCFVGAPPVVLIGPLAPALAEVSLALLHEHGVVEVPGGPLLGVLRPSWCDDFLALVFTHVFCSLGIGRTVSACALRFFLLFAEGRDDTVDGRIAFFVAHERKSLQRVLQLNGRGVGHEFVEHLRSPRHFSVVLPVAVDHAECLVVARLCFVVASALPVELTHAQQQNAFFGPGSCAFGASLLVGRQSRCCVVLCEIDIPQGVEDLVEVFLVLFRVGHGFEFGSHLACTTGLWKHFGLEDAGVEFERVRRCETNAFSQCAIGFRAVAELLFDLSEQEEESGTELAVVCFLCRRFQIGQGIGEMLLPQEEVGPGSRQFALQPRWDGVAPHLVERILRIIEPSQFGVGTCHPRACFLHHGRFGRIETGDVRKGGRCTQKIAFLKLRLPHQEPSIFQEGVKLLAAEVLFHLFAASLARVGLRFHLDAVELYGFFRFGDSAVELALADVACGLVAHGEDRQHLGVVVRVARDLSFHLVLVGFVTVEVGVVLSGEALPEA